MRNTTDQSGFTLIEALIALAIVSLVVTTCLMFRTGSVIDATEARNWRVAREVAQEILSELRAGARSETPAYDMDRTPIPSMKEVVGWSYQIVIGEEQIAEIEGNLESEMESESSDSDSSATERRKWQRERDDVRAARQRGVSYYDYREKTQLEEQDRLEREDQPPTEEDFEDVAVFVFFPNARALVTGNDTSHFVLKARLSTMAIEGLTPEQAEQLQEASGGSSSESGTAPEEGTSR